MTTIGLPGKSHESMIYYDMPFDEYCALPGINASALKGDGRHSAKHLNAYLNREIEDNDTVDRRFGRAVHSFNLEPAKFAEQFPRAGKCAAIKKNGDACGNQGTLTLDGHWFCGVKSHAPADAAPGYDYITEDEFRRLERLRDALKLSNANEYLRGPGYSEAVITWKQLGFDLKTRLDRLSIGEYRATIVDIKKCKIGKATYEESQKACTNNLYHIQSWFHVAGVKAGFGFAESQIDSHFLFIEDTSPHDTYLHTVDSWNHETGELGVDLQIATDSVVTQLVRFKRCVKSGKFEGCQPIILPDKKGILTQWFIKEKTRVN